MPESGADGPAGNGVRWEVYNPSILGIFHRVLFILNVRNYAIPLSQLEAYAYAYAEREASRAIDLFDAVRIATICASGNEGSAELLRDFKEQINERAFRKYDPELERLEKLRQSREEWDKQERWERRMRGNRSKPDGGK